MSDDNDLRHDPFAPARGLMYGFLFGMALALLVSMVAWVVIR